jgi:bifunctional UDP-N-acetylglucosamine pyrophosphorylase/glucosamine-1-phosphate N-acetyltransferase
MRKKIIYICFVRYIVVAERMTIHQAVILAGGMGKRMKASAGAKAKELPKPLLEVNGTPIIARNIAKLAERYVDIAVVINPKDRKIFEKTLADYDVEYIYQNEPKGTANALYCAKDFITEGLFLVMMGDDIADYSIDRLLQISEPTVFGFEVEDVSGWGAIVTDENGMVEDIVEKQRSGKGIVNTAVYVMPREFFEIYKQIPIDAKSGEYFLTAIFRIFRERGVRFRLKRLDNWFGINTQEELERADRTLKEGNGE